MRRMTGTSVTVAASGSLLGAQWEPLSVRKLELGHRSNGAFTMKSEHMGNLTLVGAEIANCFLVIRYSRELGKTRFSHRRGKGRPERLLFQMCLRSPKEAWRR